MECLVPHRRDRQHAVEDHVGAGRDDVPPVRSGHVGRAEHDLLDGLQRYPIHTAASPIRFHLPPGFP